MSNKIPVFKVGLASFARKLRCETHRNTGDLPCPWPNCPNGIEHNEFETRLIGVESIRRHYVRRQWLSLDGSERYCWDVPEESSWLLANLLAREELARRSPHLSLIPDKLYHYTDPAGLFGIVSSNQLWMTDYEFLNDSSELKFSLEVADSVLEQLYDKKHSSFSHIIPDWRKSLPSALQTSRLYVTSFSEDGDNLSLWRAYAPSGGVSIGLRLDLLSLMQFAGSYSNKIVYSSQDQETLIEIVAHLHLLSMEWDREKALRDHTEQFEYSKASFSRILLRHLAFIKAPSFADEREVRIAYIEDQALFERMGLKKATRRFRPKGRLLAPYVVSNEEGVGLSLASRSLINRENPTKLPLTDLVVSPQSDSALVARSFREFLDASGFDDVEVASSKIPYRPW